MDTNQGMHREGVEDVEDVKALLERNRIGPKTLKRIFAGIVSALVLPGGADARHLMGAHAGNRIYLRWKFVRSKPTFTGAALIDSYGTVFESAGVVDCDWSGGLFLAAEHFINQRPATPQDVRVALEQKCTQAQRSERRRLKRQQAVKGRRRGKGARPAMQCISLRVPVAVLAHWRASGKGWQQRMRAILSQPNAETAIPTPKRTRSPKGCGRKAINLRLPQSVLARWRATGAGWQSRAVALLSLRQ